MSRSAARRTSAVQVEKTLSPTPPAESQADDTVASTASASGVPWFWRLVLFLWATSFAFLFLYEWLAGLIKAW